MPCFEGQACETRLNSTESQADPIGDPCPVFGASLEPVGELREIFGCRAIETPRGASRGGASGASQRIADRSGQIVVYAGSSTSESGSKSKAANAHSLGPQVQPSALALPAPATSP